LNRESESKAGGIWPMVKSLIFRGLFMYVFSLLLQRSRTPTQIYSLPPEPLNETANFLLDETASEVTVILVQLPFPSELSDKGRRSPR
jgi:hypothetical protein